MPKKFPPEFKRDVVRVACRGDLSHAEVASDFDISVESVRRSVRQADIDDGAVASRTTSEQNELVQLRREKRRLEQENDMGSHRRLMSTTSHASSTARSPVAVAGGLVALVIYLTALAAITLMGDGTGSEPAGNLLPAHLIFGMWTDSASPVGHGMYYFLGNLLLLTPLAVVAQIFATDHLRMALRAHLRMPVNERRGRSM